MTSIYKATITVTVLLDAEDAASAANLISNNGLLDIAAQIDDGDWIGQVQNGPITEVPIEQVRNELIAIGNDGTFFDSLENDQGDDFPNPPLVP